MAATHTPVISAVNTDYTVNPPTITIGGAYFGSITPTVSLDGDPLTIATYTATSVTALLPTNINPGSYQLVLTNNSTQAQVTFDATIGAVGPPGPAGPTGATGTAGPTGPHGPAGATGPAGPTGPHGPAGPAGATGATGPAGPQGLTWQGAWSNSATYNLNDAVGYNGSSYISLVANNANHEPDTTPAAWSLVASAGAPGAAGPAGATGASGATGATGPAGPGGPQGPQGVPGSTGATGPQGLAWQGAWNNSAAYNLNDAVGYNGSSYISLTANNSNNEPDTSPTAWGVLASAGAEGSSSIYTSTSNNSITVTTYGGTQTVAAVSLPAGQYWLSAKVYAENASTTANSRATCSLFNAAQLLDVADAVMGPWTGTGIAQSATISLQAPLNVSDAVYITVQCTAQNAGYYTQSEMVTAIQTSNLVVQPPVF
jgi:hypothetical protein